MDDAELLYEKQYEGCAVRVELLRAARVVIYTMDGYLPASETSAYVEDLLEAIAEHRPVGAVADARRMKVLNEDFQRVIQTRFWPAIAALGVRRNPAIMPESLLATRSVVEMVDDAPSRAPAVVEGSVELAVFASMEECLAWIGELGE